MLADKTVRSVNMLRHETKNPPPGSYDAKSSFGPNKKPEDILSVGIIGDPNKNVI